MSFLILVAVYFQNLTFDQLPKLVEVKSINLKPSLIQTAKFSKDSSKVAFGFDDSFDILQLDIKNSFKLTATKSNSGHISALSYNANNSELFFGDTHKEDDKKEESYGIKAFDLGINANAKYFTGITDRASSISLSENSKYLIVGDTSGKVLIWDTLSLKLVKTFSDHSEQVSNAYFFDNDKYLITFSKDKKIFIYSSNNFKLVHKYLGHAGQVLDARTDAKCKFLFSIDHLGEVRKWNFDTSEVVKKEFLGNGGKEYLLNAACISPNASYISIAGFASEMFQLYEMNKFKLVSSSNHSKLKSVSFMIFSEDSKFLLSCAESTVPFESSQVNLYELVVVK